MVGDRSIDMRAGRAAGVRTVLLGSDARVETEAAITRPDACFPSLLAFAEALTANQIFHE
jgi:histidinol phosphatase-like enzyme